jgi:phage-related protein
MAVWSYQPQNVMTETLRVGTRVTYVGGSAITGTQTENVARTWNLQYSLVTTAEAGSMAAFYVAQGGPWVAFDWTNPNDAASHRVRFDSGLDLALFQPALLRTTGLTFVEVRS